MRVHPLEGALACLLVLAISLLAHGQGSPTGSLAGTVTDAAGDVVPGVAVTARNNATGVESNATTADNGTFNVPALPSGTYTVTFTTRGFKKSVVANVKIDVGAPSAINVTLEAGDVSETVTVVGEGGELLHSQTANVATTITGRQITDLPFSSRDALDLVLLLPGTATPGRPRTSTVNGLPKGALTITIDGINVQDNLLKSNDGFFTYIRPRIDAIDEVTLSTATPGAESSGEGAVQIKFVTRGGTNDLRGSLYWYHRNPALNANYYFNNLAGLARDRVLLNQYGARVGGPVRIPGLYDGRNKSFFFVNYEEFRLPEQVTRQRNILTPAAEAGNFTYGTGANQRTINVLQLAATRRCAGTAANPVFCTSTVDPLVAKTLSAIRASTAQGSVAPFDANRQLFTFTNSGGQRRYFATVRFDHQLTSKHHLENIWNYQVFRNSVDFLNGVDPAFPGLLGGVGGQNSNRFSNSTGLRSTLSSTVVNEARFGLTGGTSLFRAELSPASYSYLNGFIFGTAAGTGGWSSAFSINNPNAVRSASRRNSPVKQFTDNLTWVKGRHSMSFGGDFTQINTWSQSLDQLVPSLSFGVDTTDPANSLFTAANFQAVTGVAPSNTDLSLAAGLYAILTGRVTQVSGTAYLDEETGQYRPLGPYVERIRQRQGGLYAQDSWRVRPNLTLVYGMRYEVQFPFRTLNDVYTATDFDSVYGVSGAGNLFRPGTLAGSVPTFDLFEPGDKAYNTDLNNFGPSLGVAWSPPWRGGLAGLLFGGEGRSVLRAGYSVAFVREGTNVASSILGANPGGSVSLTRSVALGNLPAGTLLRNLVASNSLQPAPGSPAFPLRSTSVNDSINVFDPDLKLGNVRSWTFGFQRELTKNMVFEARYVGNRGIDLWRQYNINEVNVVENRFVNEFRLAQANLAAHVLAGCGSSSNPCSFAYRGPGTGTSPLPTILAFFRGPTSANNLDPNNPAQYTSTNFTSSTFTSLLSLHNSQPRTFASTMWNNATRRANALAAGLPANIFYVNPDFFGGGAFIVDNSGRSWYDAMTLELRRRMSQGLLLQGSYTYGKAQTNMFASSSAVLANFATLRDGSLDKVASPFDIRHSFKANWIYELPLGRGRTFFGGARGAADKLLGGWEVHGAWRAQSGTPFNLGNVQLVGMTKRELQDAVEIRKDPSGAVFFLPDDIILNTQRAFNTSATSATGFGSLGAPTGRYIAPAGSNGCVAAYAGQCGFANLVLYGPKFNRWDLSVVKKIRFTETANLEFRTELLNAFNNINFKVGSAANDVSSVTNFSNAAFGRTTSAYQDISTTNDPGARMVQFVMRLNF